MKSKVVLAVAVVLLAGCTENGGTILVSPSGTPIVTVTPHPVERKVGESQQFSAQVTGGNAASNDVSWERGFSILAFIVNRSGLATCLQPGSGGVIATYVGNRDARGVATLTCVAVEPPPALLLIKVSPASVDVNVNGNATNEHVCTFRIENTSTGAMTMSYTSGHPALVLNSSGATLSPGGVGNPSVFFRGPHNQPFTTEVTITATTSEGEQKVKVPFKIGVQ